MKIRISPVFFRSIPHAGVGLGILSGLIFRSLGFDEKDPGLCEKALGNFPLLQAINQIKQVEIQTCSLLIPLLPLLLQIVRERSAEKNITRRLGQSLQKHCTVEKTVYLSAALGAMFFAANAKDWLGGFDPSGHVMLKIQLTSLTQKTLSFDKGGIFSIFLGIYALTDALFLHNTASYCHTINELAAGVGVGIFLSFGAKLLSKTLNKKYT